MEPQCGDQYGDLCLARTDHVTAKLSVCTMNDPKSRSLRNISSTAPYIFVFIAHDHIFLSTFVRYLNDW